MTELTLPWLELSVLVPLLGALALKFTRDVLTARRWCLILCAITFALTLAEWEDFSLQNTFQAHDPLDQTHGALVIDELSAPLLPLAALIYTLVTATTLRTKMRRFSFSWTLVSLSLTLAMFSCKEPWLLILLLALQTIPPWLELRARGKPTRVFELHMGLFVLLLVGGWYIVELEGRNQLHSLWAVAALLGAIFIRTGIVPVHCWMTDLFEHATFGTALLYSTPVAGAYAAIRLVVPIAPDEVLHLIGIVAIVTSVYAAGMAIVQQEARRFFCYILLSHTALVLAGLESVSTVALTGALCVWLSIGLSLGGFGITLRALEARRGRLSLADFQGLYNHTPALAVCFMLTGLASVGFPGTLGFIGTEMLIDGTVLEYKHDYPYVGFAVVAAAALNGIAVVRAYFRIFTGTTYQSSVSLQIGPRERFAVLLLTVMIIGGGMFPQPGVASRHHGAVEILRERQRRMQDALEASRPVGHVSRVPEG